MLKRNSNIELLRILSMIMIILGHCNIYGNYDITNMNHFFNKFVIGNTYLGNLGVIIFVLTTGYFMIQKEIRIKKVILFELQVLFYSVGIYILFRAGEFVGKLYDAFSKQYKDITNEQSQKDLNKLCVRLVFCLYAGDAGLFGRKNVFHDYLSKYDDLGLMRKNLIELFKILDTKLEDRDPYLDDDLNQFSYVNGGLFSNENIEIPLFSTNIIN